jgi:hypothetical protein
MDIEIAVEDGMPCVTNGLSHGILRVAARIPGMDGTWRAEGIPPGGRGELVNDPDAMRAILSDLNANLTDASWMGPARVAAECAGLPYLEDGRLGGTLVAGRYFYLRTAAAEP